MYIDGLVKLTSKAWSLDVLAQMARGVSGRQAALLAATGANRTAFSQTVRHLIDLGFLERNPGHGHPLRPEFRLTESGLQAARMADQILCAVPDRQDVALLRRNWSVPVLALSGAPRRFADLRRGLGQITDRALSNSLKSLEDVEWIQRDIHSDSRPPFPTYRAVNTGLSICEATGLHQQLSH